MVEEEVVVVDDDDVGATEVVASRLVPFWR